MILGMLLGAGIASAFWYQRCKRIEAQRDAARKDYDDLHEMIFGNYE